MKVFKENAFRLAAINVNGTSTRLLGPLELGRRFRRPTRALLV